MNYNPGDIIGDKYQILGIIGGGAMGTVYQATHIKMDKPVAIKVLHGDFASQLEYKKRFKREASAAASMEHSNICTVMDYDTTVEGVSYIVMELLSGETLTQRIARMSTIPPIQAVRIMRQLMGALSCAYEKGIVHRDIKPDNIFLIQREGVDDFVKLIDFGVAHLETPGGDLKTLTHTGQIYGTPQYISPEQAQGDPIDHRTDLYAAGVIFYEMLTGRAPFEGKNYIELLIKQVNEPAPHLPSVLPQSAIMDQIIQILLSKDPNDRYASALDVIPDLDDLLIRLSTEGVPEGALSSRLGSHSMSISMQMINASGDNQPTDSGQLSAEQSAQKVKYPWHLIVLLAILLAVIILFTLNFLGGIFNFDNPVTLPAVQIGDDSQKGSDAPEQEQTAAPAFEQPTPFEILSVGFNISEDSPLLKIEKIKSAIDLFRADDAQNAMLGLVEVRSLCLEDPNYLRLYILGAQKAKYPEDLIVGAIVHLLQIEPQATQNPDIVVILQQYFGSGTHSLLSEKLSESPSDNVALNMARLITRSSYNVRKDHPKSRPEYLNRMLEFYSSLDVSSVPRWLNNATKYWEPGLDCEKRRKVLMDVSINITQKDYNALYEEILIPMSTYFADNPPAKECSVILRGGKKKPLDCNQCIDTWLNGEKGAISDYRKRMDKYGIIQADDNPLENEEFNFDNE